MLHWLAGQRAPEGPSDPDATGYIEPPETPAPVFAVRAFKHAIFGTPPTAAAKPRRNSNHERERHRLVSPNKRIRPEMARPRSTNDAPTLSKSDTETEPLASPTKGILMTPGTAAARRKTVSFGEHVVDNESKKPLAGSKTGLPSDFPGKYPSPWADKPTNDDTQSKEEGHGRKSKLTEELEKMRDSSTKRKRGKNASSAEDANDYTTDLAEPQSESGKYWKREYDLYREKTQKEVKKLVMKQKLAKNYARDKDIACTDFADQLRQERKRAERLEKRAAELEARVKELEAKLREGTGPAGDTAQTAVPVRSQPSLSQASNYTQKAPAVESQPSEPIESPARKQVEGDIRDQETVSAISSKPQAELQEGKGDEFARPSSQNGTVLQRLIIKDKPSVTWGAMDSKYRRRPERMKSKPQADVWTRGVDSSSLSVTNTTDNRPVSPRAVREGRAVTSGTDATPLESLSINSLPAAQAAVRDVAPRSPDAARQARPSAVARPDGGSPLVAKKRKDSFDVAMDMPWPQGHNKDPLQERFNLLKKSDGEIAPTTTPLSPFQDEAISKPAKSASATITSFKSPSLGTASKENVSPSSKTAAAPAISMPAGLPGVNQRIVSKDGKEVSRNRVEEAAARIQARKERRIASESVGP